jgi:transcriptional regulator with XRE-family HTH domain
MLCSSLNQKVLIAMERFGRIAGEVLRAARREAGLTLRDVWTRSKGEFKPSALGGYERGERSISLDKFCTLAEIYGAPADRLLGEVLAGTDPGGRARVVVDLTALADLGGAESPRSDLARELGRFIHFIRSRRGDFLTNIVSLRSGDVEAFALSLGVAPSVLLKQLRQAIRDDATPDSAITEADAGEVLVLRP